MSLPEKLKLAFSTCPNDTFMFDAMVHDRIDTEGLSWNVTMDDIMELNSLAAYKKPDVVKISYNTYGRVIDEYQLLNAGSALGRDCGPLLISAESLSIEDIIEKGLTIGIPGEYTTANLLLNFFMPEASNRKVYRFDQIIPALKRKEIDAGVIIHENRFTYQEEGMHLIRDLGTYWESETGLPIPLGAIVAKRSLGQETIARIERVLERSVTHAFENRNDSREFVHQHAQELSDSVTNAHIDLYVNEYSLALGEEGRAAVRKLLGEGVKMGLYPENVLTKFDQEPKFERT